MNVLTELRFAFYIVALSFIWLMFEFLVGLHDRYIDYHAVVTLLAILIPVVFVYLGMRRKRDVDYDGVATWLQLFRSGLIITLFTAIMVVPMQYAFHNFINPRFFDNMIAYAVEHAAANSQDVDKAREEALATFNLKSYIIQSVIGVAVIGTLLSVIDSFLLRRRNLADVPTAVAEPFPQTPIAP